MSSLLIRLFGRFSAECNGGGVDGLAGAKVQELFSYLLLYRDRPHPREALAGLLWGDNPAAQSKKYLRQVLWELQTACDSVAPGATRVLTVETDWIHLNGEADLWLDVAVFEAACAAVRGVLGETLDTATMQMLADAVALYRGDLLEGCYQDWYLHERERLQTMYLIALDKLMGYCEAQGRYEDGLAYGDQSLHYDRARERTHQRLMRLHYLRGDRAGALRQYERCAAALAQELSVAPSERTRMLRETIKADRLSPTSFSPVPSSPSRDPRLPGLARLRQLCSRLAELQGEVEREIQHLERSLSQH